MRYQVKCQGALGDGVWSIAAEDGSVSYRVDAARWQTEHAFAIVDEHGAVAAEGRMRSTWRHQICDLYRAGELAANISTSLLRDIRARFIGEVPGPDMLGVDGDFTEQQYRFFRCSRTVAVVSTVWEDGDEEFGVEIRHCEDQPLVLAAAVAIRVLCGEPLSVRLSKGAGALRPVLVGGKRAARASA